MERALVVTDPRPGVVDLLEEAAEFAVGGDATLHLLTVVTEDFTDADRDRMHELTGGRYDFSADGAATFAADLAADTLPEDRPYETSGAVGERAGRILAAQENQECDHVFLLGRRRSPAGKAVFGDATQRVLLDAPVPVTVHLA